MFIQYRVRLVLIYMHVALFKIRLLRKSVSNIRGSITVFSQNFGAVAAAPEAPAPTRLLKVFILCTNGRVIFHYITRGYNTAAVCRTLIYQLTERVFAGRLQRKSH